MEILYNIEALKNILYDFSELTGITLSVYDYNSNHLADCMHGSHFCIDVHRKIGKAQCEKCAKELVLKCQKSLKYEESVCFMGLYEACMPIIIDNVWAGHISIGGIRTENSVNTDCFNYQKSPELFNTQPYYTKNQINALKNMLPKIIFNSAITFKYDNRLNEITDYIKNNLDKKLTIKHLSQKFHICKNSLYNLFEHHLSMTINEYITHARIEKAKTLMKKGVRGEMLATETGIESYSYFCRLFKKQTNLSPTAFCKYHGF